MKEEARKCEIKRVTGETDICLSLNIDGKGDSDIDTQCGFLNHMLTLFAKHGGFDLSVKCRGDVDVDFHHTAEDIGIALGAAFSDILGDKSGICRYGWTALPMDEALILSAVDFSGRCHLEYALEIPSQKVGDFDTELVEEFFLAFVRNAKCALHIRQLSGNNSHHIIEGAFKSVSRSIKAACARDASLGGGVMSTKGVL